MLLVMKTKKLSFCAVMAALATVLMLIGYFPYLTYAVPCIASLAIMAVVIELNKKSAFLTYLASLLPIFLFCEMESKLLYICLVGFYPILKALFEKLPSRILEYLLKIVCLNVAVFLIYLASTFVFGISFDDMGQIGEYGAIVLIAAANIAFLAYDFCLTTMAQFYIIRIHKSVKKLLK